MRQAKETSISYIVASSWHLTLFHDEDARSNNPQTVNLVYNTIKHYSINKTSLLNDHIDCIIILLLLVGL